MNRHERRKAAKLPRRHKQPDARPIIIPDDLRRDIAYTVRDAELDIDASGGLCFYRAIIGREFLRLLGIAGDLCLGGMVYRAGPNPERDLVEFCGPGRVGQVIDGKLIGHYSLERERLDRSDVRPCHPWGYPITPAGRDRRRSIGRYRKCLKTRWTGKRWRSISGSIAYTTG